MKNTFTKFLSIVLAALMCMSTLAIGAFAEEECAHANSTDYGVKEATCTEMGGHLWKCNDCGEEYATDVVPALGHDVENKKTVDATCEEDAYVEGVCKNCKETIKEVDEGSALGHEPGVELKHQDPNCETGAEGYDYYECENCGEQLPVAGSEIAGKHDYAIKEIVSLPECGVEGKVIYECLNDGCDYEATVKIAALEHKMTAVNEVPATCEKEGVAAHNVCDYCGGLFEVAKKDNKWVATSAEKLVIAKAHTAPIKVSETEGTCTKEATTTYKCGDCEAEWTEKGELNHSWKEHKTEATCDKWGYLNYFCENCGAKYNNAEDADDAMNEQYFKPTGHDLEEEPIEGPIAPGCLTNGYTVYQCKNANCNFTDGKVKIEEEDTATGHDLEKVEEKVPAKCGVAGTEAKYACQNAGCTHTVGGDAIKALEHEYVSTVIAQTCVTDGYTTTACKFCGEEKADATRTDVVKADGTSHVMKVTSVKPALCGVEGEITSLCEICDGNDTVESIPALEHDYTGAPVMEFAGSCVERAYAVYECKHSTKENTCPTKTVMGDFRTSVEGHEQGMADKGVDPINVKIERAGTCTVKQHAIVTCGACQVKYADYTKYNTTDHNRVEMPAKDADCTTNTKGYEADGVMCTVCDDIAKPEEWAEVPTFINVKHVLDKTCEAQKATCTAAGWNEFVYCSVCDAVDGVMSTKVLKEAEENKIPVHDYSKTKAEVKGQAATCTADGWIDFEYCTACYTLAEAKALAANKIAKFDHKVSGATAYVKVDALCVVAANGCEDFSFNAYVCELCEGIKIDSYTPAKQHTWVEGETFAPACDKYGYTEYECSVCGETKEDDIVAAPGHKNAAGEFFFGLCDETITDRKCVVDGCGAEFTTENETHTYEDYTRHEATCVLPGYDVAICTKEGCTGKDITNYTAPLGHTDANADNLVEDECIDATHTTKGLLVWVCDRCEAKVTKELDVLAGVKVTITSDSGILKNNKVVNGGKVVFTIALNTADLKANSLITTFSYDSDVLTFVDAKVENIFGEGTTNLWAANVTVISDDDEPVDTVGELKIYSYAANTADNKIQDVAISGEVVYAVLTFEVAVDAPSATELVTESLELVNAAEEPATEHVELDAETVEISTLGAVNNDNFINSVDALAIRKILTGELVIDETVITYSAEADIDKNGEITLNDFALLAKYLVGEITYEELVLAK